MIKRSILLQTMFLLPQKKSLKRMYVQHAQSLEQIMDRHSVVKKNPFEQVPF